MKALGTAAVLLALALAGCTAPSERTVLQVSPSFDLVRLTNTPGLHEGQPALSGDGSVAVFTRYSPQGTEVWAMRLPGGEPVRLSRGPLDRDHAPTVSHDGGTAAWVTVLEGDSDVAASRTDGTGHHLVTSNSDRDADPALSPDGQQVAFVTNRWGNPEVVVARTDGSSEKRLTDNRVPEFQPSFSRDGTRITFISYPEESEVYVVNPDASGLLRLTQNGETDAFPDLDLKGQLVAYAAGLEGEREVWVQQVGRGGAATKLTDNAWDEWTPRITSDGTQIVFRSQGSRNATEYMVMSIGVDGRGLVPLAKAQDFAMSADGRRILLVAQQDLWLLTRR